MRVHLCTHSASAQGVATRAAAATTAAVDAAAGVLNAFTLTARLLDALCIELARDPCIETVSMLSGWRDEPDELERNPS